MQSAFTIYFDKKWWDSQHLRLSSINLNILHKYWTQFLKMLQNRAVQLQTDAGVTAAAPAASHILANEAVRYCFQDQKTGNLSADHDNHHDSITGSIQRQETQGADCPICFDDLGRNGHP
mmetsp:Transcript_21164/g.31337  ORF Transcript_21164/g.31337 Transcript_21164/m.31337 type:complete len:120 (-) Transcript_21164:346-705(-)